MVIWKTSLQKLDIDKLHCCTFALGGIFEHSHKEIFCIKCLTCFLFFKIKVLPFLDNSNKEVSSNKKDEVVTMVAVVPKLSYVVSHYASHRLRENVQFSDIKKNIQSIKTDP